MLVFSSIDQVLEGSENFILALETEYSRLDQEYLFKNINTEYTNQVLWFSEDDTELTLDFDSQFVRKAVNTIDGYKESGIFFFPHFSDFEKYRDQLDQKNYALDYKNEKIMAIPHGKPDMQVEWGEFKPALFLDRDGIINKDNGYIYEYENVEYVSDIFKLVRSANQQGYLTFVLTNQSGVGRGYYNEDQVKVIHDKMHKKFENEKATISFWNYSPYHQEGQGEYRGESLTRKPYPGMIHQLQRIFPIDLTKSIMIGDKLSDALLLKGPRYIHLEGQYDLSKATHKVYKTHAEIIQDLFSAI